MFTRNDLAMWRKTAKLTQQELADRIGANRVTIAKLEKGTYNPSLGLALRIVDALSKRLKSAPPTVEDIWQL